MQNWFYPCCSMQELMWLHNLRKEAFQGISTTVTPHGLNVIATRLGAIGRGRKERVRSRFIHPTKPRLHPFWCLWQTPLQVVGAITPETAVKDRCGCCVSCASLVSKLFQDDSSSTQKQSSAVRYPMRFEVRRSPNR